MKINAAVLCLLIFSAAGLLTQGIDSSKISGPYLGQKPPGGAPEVFAPGIVSTGPDELNSAFSPDGNEFYFCVRNIQGAASIFQMKIERGAWSKPRLLPFASRYGDIDVSVSPEGDALLFSSLRPRLGDTEPRKDNDFWRAARQGDGWGEAVHLGPAINSDSHDYYPMMARNGRIYFSSQREGPRTNNIYRSEQVDGAYAAAVKLGEAINTEFREFDPYVSPDESMLIFASDRPGGQGSSDLYVSFRDVDDSWTSAVNMGDTINSPGPEFCPTLSPDGKYLFFTSMRFARDRFPEAPFRLADFHAAHNRPENGVCDIYWVSAKIIEALRPQAGLPVQAGAGNAAGAAVATYVSTPEQERAVKAMIRSIRERGGSCKESSIYVVTADPESMPCGSLKMSGVEVLPLDREPSFLNYPLAIKALAAAQVERKVKDRIDTLIWLDPGVLVLNSLEALVLSSTDDAAMRPVTLANTIAIPPHSEPNDYWKPIYEETGLDYKKLPALRTMVNEVPIQPYYNCEVFSFNPKRGLAAEWVRLLTRMVKDEDYQKTVCRTFLRKLFLHQAVLSAVITARVKPDRIKALPLTSAYPFSQHQRLPEARRAARLNDISVVIFDRTWQQDKEWLDRVPASEPYRSWLLDVYREYLDG